MKNVYAFLILLLSCTAFAQNIAIRGLVKDAVTAEPVIAASVGVQNSGIGTITNEEGNFQMTVPKTAIVIISCLGYKPFAVSASEFSAETKTIALVQSEEVLQEVMVTKIPLYMLLREVVQTSTARFNKPILLHTYYREFVKLNNKYNKFSDGLLDYHISGTTKKTKSELIIKQNRSFFLVDDSEEESESFLDVRSGISGGYAFEYLNKSILDEDHYQDYEFTLKSKKDKEGNELYAITFEPKTEVEKALFKGAITYDPQTKLIYDIDIFMAPSHQQYARKMNLLIAHVSFLDAKYKAAYKMVNNNYLMAFNNRYSKIRIWTKKRDYLCESRSDLIVTDFEKDDQPYNKKEVFKKRDLYNKPTHYTEKFWQKNNAIVLTSEEEKVISSLEKAAVTIPKAE